MCRHFLRLLLALAVLVEIAPGAAIGRSIQSEPGRPNIVWIIVEDQSRPYGCYGEPLVTTPHVDKLAADGVRFAQAIVTAPVCSTNRSALITGMYQTSIGAHHHRSGRGTEKIRLPAHVRLIPQLFKEAGYYTANGGGPAGPDRPGRSIARLGKTDYNFEWDRATYDGSDWSGRRDGQPFFAQIQLSGGKNRSVAHNPRLSKLVPLVDAREVTLPVYYPDHPVIRADWADYLNSANYVDYQVGQIMRRLEQEGIADETIVFFMTDHGISHARGKQFCYEEGLLVPLIIHGPAYVQQGAVRNDLVAHIDVAATSLYFAGIDIPDYMQARPLFGPDFEPRRWVVSARDRCDETVDRIRSVRTARFKYIRNFYPKRPHLQPCAYKDKKEILIALREWHAAGKLNSVQSQLFRPTRPPEELYDLDNDPNELHNLADAPAYKQTLTELRQTLERWIEETGDMGRFPESDAMYDSDMKVYVEGIRRRGGKMIAHARVIEANIALMKRWQAEGK